MGIPKILEQDRVELLRKRNIPKYTQKRLKEIREREKSLIRKPLGERKNISGSKVLSNSQLQRLVSLKTGYQIKDVKEILDSYIEVILNEIYNCRPVSLHGLGTFYTTYRMIRPTKSPLDNSQIWLSQPVTQLNFYIKKPLALKMREIILSEEEIFSHYYPAEYEKIKKERVPKELDSETLEKVLKAKERNKEIFGEK